MAVHVVERQKSTQRRKTIIFQLKIEFFEIFEKLQKNKQGCFFFSLLRVKVDFSET